MYSRILNTKGVKVIIVIVWKRSAWSIDKAPRNGIQTNVFTFGLTDILQRYDIAHIIGGVISVGDPNLSPSNLNIRIDEGIILQDAVITVSEVMGQEKVTILVIIQGKQLKIGDRRTTFSNYRACFWPLFGKNTRYGCSAKLKLCFHPEQTLGTLNETAV